MAGYVHVYTGDGKGKTTAALGLALRAAGAGWKVFFAQFGKPAPASEYHSLERLDDQITMRRFDPHYGDEQAGADALAECRRALASGRYRLVVLDEANLGPSLQLFPLQALLELIDAKSDDVELVITGRYAHPKVLDRADLVTEMRELKHYYRRGVLARTGIER
jgi:cob(I)alamin adenosyltransferase